MESAFSRLLKGSQCYLHKLSCQRPPMVCFENKSNCCILCSSQNKFKDAFGSNKNSENGSDSVSMLTCNFKNTKSEITSQLVCFGSCWRLATFGLKALQCTFKSGLLPPSYSYSCRYFLFLFYIFNKFSFL